MPALRDPEGGASADKAQHHDPPTGKLIKATTGPVSTYGRHLAPQHFARLLCNLWIRFAVYLRLQAPRL